MSILKKIVWTIFFLALLFSVSGAGIEGNSKLLSWFAASLTIALILYWILSILSKFFESRTQDTPRLSLEEQLIKHEPILRNLFRVSVVLLLALSVDKIDRYSWDIARDQLSEITVRLGQIENALNEIDSSIQTQN